MAMKEQPDWVADGELSSNDAEYLEDNGWTGYTTEEAIVYFSENGSFGRTIRQEHGDDQIEIRAPLNESEKVKDVVEYFGAELYGGIPEEEEPDFEVSLESDIKGKMGTGQSPRSGNNSFV
jgi:hypothetical protein